MDRISQRSVSNAKLLQEAQAARSAGLNGGLSAIAADGGRSSKTTQDGILYLVGEVTTGGNVELFRQLSEQKSREGLTNFDGNSLNSGTNAIIDGIAIEIATTITDEDPKSLAYNKVSDAAILNSEFSFLVDGKVILDLPVYEAHNPNTTRTNDEKYRGIGHLPIIEAQKNLEAWFNFPTGVTPDNAANKRHYVRVSFRCMKTVSR